jgi:phage baseplate assembly protein W
MSIEKSLYVRNVIQEVTKPYSAPLSKAYRGLSTVAATNGNFSLYDIGLIKQDIINHFHIRQGERLENPTFGTIIWDLLFEPLTDDVKSAITENVTDIINYDPRVRVDNIVVSTYESGIQIECELTYLPYSISEALRLRFDNDNNIIS